ncbi:hypothetical protein BaRGS_00010130, partial [Batillaria attramentaria]
KGDGQFHELHVYLDRSKNVLKALLRNHHRIDTEHRNIHSTSRLVAGLVPARGPHFIEGSARFLSDKMAGGGTRFEMHGINFICVIGNLLHQATPTPLS